jgi:excisionase family DNA binding protein
VAEFLDISISTVRRLIRNGELKAIRIGASVRITEASLDRLLNAGRPRSTPRGKKLAAPGG